MLTTYMQEVTGLLCERCDIFSWLVQHVRVGLSLYWVVEANQWHFSWLKKLCMSGSVQKIFGSPHQIDWRCWVTSADSVKIEVPKGMGLPSRLGVWGVSRALPAGSGTTSWRSQNTPFCTYMPMLLSSWNSVSCHIWGQDRGLEAVVHLPQDRWYRCSGVIDCSYSLQ